MSSINNNGGAYINNDGAIPNTEQLAQQHLAQQVRKNSDKALTANEKARDTSIIEMVGMTPTDAANAINGEAPATTTSTAGSNKYSAAGAVSKMPPPTAPKATVTAKTQALYSSMHSDVSHALGSAATGEKAIDWSALSPTMSPTSTAAETQSAVAAHTTAATDAVTTAARQFAKVSSGSMTMAFLMLRSQGQSDGLNINNQMGDMQNSIREADLNQQIKSDKEAQVKLDKAAKKQAAMKKAGPLVEAIIAILTAVITVVTAGTATGMALVLAAMVIGFVAGGAVGGKKNGNGFDFNSAITGMSIGSMILPVGAVLKAIVKAVTAGLEKVGLKAGEKAVEKVAEKSAAKATTTAAADAGGTTADALKAVETNVQRTASQTSRKGLQKAEQQASKATDRVSATQAKAGAQEGDAASSSGSTSGSTHINNAASAMISAIFKQLSPQLTKMFTESQEVVNGLSKMNASFKGMTPQKVTSIIENSLYAGQIITGATQAGGNYAVAKENISAQKALLEGKFWGEGAKIAQDSWKNTQDFLSTMQDQHNSGITQIQQILASHNQAASKAISNISA